jgi:sirohydrochlorin cobaltochelatase
VDAAEGIAMENGGRLDLGVLLVGHGTRDQQGLAEFHVTVRQVAEHLPSLAVEPAFLELALPTIAVGFERLVERNKRRIVVAPLLLFAAGHAKQDIPVAIDAVAQKHPGVAWRQAEVLGCHEALIELSALRFQEALATIRSPTKASSVDRGGTRQS